MNDRDVADDSLVLLVRWRPDLQARVAELATALEGGDLGKAAGIHTELMRIGSEEWAKRAVPG